MNKKNLLKDVLLAVASAIICAVNTVSFVESANLFPSGFSGIAHLVSRSLLKFADINISYSFIYILLNIPVILFVYKTVSKHFTLVSIIQVGLTSLLIKIIPNFTITNDLMLNAVFGGIISGVSGSLVLAGNGCAGGLDFVSVYVAKKKHKSIWNETFAFNVLILIIAGLLFGWDASLYSIIYQFVATQVVTIFDNRYKRSCLIIVAQKTDEILDVIHHKYHHSATILNGIGGFTNEEKKVIYTIVGEYEYNELSRDILEIDSHAFINVTNSTRVIGNFVEKPY